VREAARQAPALKATAAARPRMLSLRFEPSRCRVQERTAWGRRLQVLGRALREAPDPGSRRTNLRRARPAPVLAGLVMAPRRRGSGKARTHSCCMLRSDCRPRAGRSVRASRSRARPGATSVETRACTTGGSVVLLCTRAGQSAYAYVCMHAWESLETPSPLLALPDRA
jgi:hypothetical protein